MNIQATEERLAVKTREQRFLTILQTEFQYVPREAQEVLAVAQEVLVPSVAAMQPGQMRVLLAAATAPHGRPLREAQLVEVVWIVDAGREDLTVRAVHGATALRRVRLMRLAEEALEQGGLATEEDLARPAQHGVPRADARQNPGRRSRPKPQSHYCGLVSGRL